MSRQTQYQRKATAKSINLHTLYRTYSHKSSFLLVPAIAVVGIMALVSAFFLISDFSANSYAIDDPNDDMIDDQHYVSLSVSDANLSFTPSGSSTVNSKQVNITLSTNVPTGAKLYLSTADNTNALYKDGNTSSSSPTIKPTSTTTTLASMPVNSWGYSLNNATYQAVPTANSAALIANVDDSSVGTTSGGVVSATIPVYYGAKVDSSLPAGTYSNKVVYAAIGTIPISISSVTVSVDGGAVDNLQVGNVNTIVVTTDLMTSEFGTPRVYYTTTSPSGTTECSDVSVAKNSQGYMTITCAVAPITAATGVTLHITQGSSGDWKWGDFTHVLPDVVDPVSYMQDFTAGQCDSMTQGEQIQLVDSRDGKTYWAGKLPDGNCWMTQNLDLDLSTGQQLTPADTNIPSNWTPRTSTTIYTSGYNNSETGKSYDPGDVYYGNTSGSDAHYHAGNYYQWSAATAGYTGTSQSTQSICPTGWILPSRDQFQTLIRSGLTRDNFMDAPYYYPLSGNIYNNALSGARETGRYWSATPHGSNNAYLLTLSLTYVDMGNPVRHCGQPVRCMAAG